MTMYARSTSQSEGIRDQSTKSSLQHINNRHVSQAKERERKKNETLKQKHPQNNKAATNHSAKANSAKHQKGALRSFGNWSEHVSSSGKIYYYHNKSEVSQWEKPKEWIDSKAVDLKAHDKSKTSQRGGANLNRSNSKPGSSEADYRRGNHDRDYRNKPDRDYRDVDYRDNQSKEIRRVTSVDKDYRPRDHTATSVGSNGHPLTQNKDYVPSTGEFYDYSTWGSRATPQVNGLSSSENTQSSQQSQDADKG
uniref:WW domain-containing protein n=1 Tax=Ciona savignyi TaxID=51511 RepID=H2ZIN8_CIOSA